MTTTPTAPRATASTFARGGRRGERRRRQLAEGDRDHAVTVLVVDDNQIFRRGMVRAVERYAGLDLVGEADSGEAALDAIARLRPDVVLLDLRMPDLDGLSVLERLRSAGPPPPACRVLIVSATLDDDVERAAGAAGAAGCIGKDRPRADICATALRLARQ
jgi:DNA-binding NarL/FixJ family response regulator